MENPRPEQDPFTKQELQHAILEKLELKTRELKKRVEKLNEKVDKVADVIGPLESPWVCPSSYDVMITDIRTIDLKTDVSAALTIEYLSRVASDTCPTWPLHSIIYGNNRRVMVSAVVECDRPHQEITRCNVHFLFDTCAPGTYLTRETFQALGVDGPDVHGTLPMVYRVNGTRMPVFLSHGHFKDVNILGMDFLDRTSASFKLSFGCVPIFTVEHGDS